MLNDKELKQKRAALVEQSRALAELAVKEKRAMTTEENTNYDRIFSEVNSLDDTIKRVEQQREMERSNAAIREETRENAGKGTREQKISAAWRGYFTGETSKHGLSQELRALQSDLDESGGFLAAPQELVKQLIKNVDDQTIIRQKATVFSVKGAESLGVPTLTANPDDADWTGEITSIGEDSSMKFGKRELRPKPLTKLVKVSRQLMRVSALPIEEILAQRLAYKMAIPQEKGFMTGTGANQPLGVFTASADGIPTTQDVSTNNTTTAFTFDGLINAKFKLKSQYHKTAEWIFHRDAIKMLATLKDGMGQYLWQPSRQVSEPDMLLGRPVNLTEYAPNTFTTGLYVGIFGDFSNYWIAESVDLEIQRADELFAGTNQVGFFARAQIDGQPVLAEAFARVKLA